MLVHGYKQANNPFDQFNASLLNTSINNNNNNNKKYYMTLYSHKQGKIV